MNEKIKFALFGGDKSPLEFDHPREYDYYLQLKWKAEDAGDDLINHDLLAHEARVLARRPHTWEELPALRDEYFSSLSPELKSKL